MNIEPMCHYIQKNLLGASNVSLGIIRQVHPTLKLPPITIYPQEHNFHCFGGTCVPPKIQCASYQVVQRTVEQDTPVM